MAIKPRFHASMVYHIFLNNGPPRARRSAITLTVTSRHIAFTCTTSKYTSTSIGKQLCKYHNPIANKRTCFYCKRQVTVLTEFTDKFANKTDDTPSIQMCQKGEKQEKHQRDTKGAKMQTGNQAATERL